MMFFSDILRLRGARRGLYSMLACDVCRVRRSASRGGKVRSARSAVHRRLARRNPRRKPDRGLISADVGDTLADNIEGGAMRGRGEHDVQTGGDGDALVEALELGRDLALVVIHRQHAVVVAGKRLDVDGVARAVSYTHLRAHETG